MDSEELEQRSTPHPNHQTDDYAEDGHGGSTRPATANQHPDRDENGPEEAEHVEPLVEERAYSELGQDQEPEREDNYEEPERVYAEEADVYGGMAESENPVYEDQNEEPIGGDERAESNEQESLVPMMSEPRITHTGSRYRNDNMSGDFTLQQSIGGYELEAIQSIFKLFDYQNDGTVKASDIGEILRCLNFNPTEAEVAEIINEVAPDGMTSNWDNFLPKAAELMESGRFQPAAEEELLAAFCTLDPNLSGLLTVKQLRDALTMFGEPLTDDEFDDLIKFAPRDPKSGMVNYKEYAKELCTMK